MTSLNAQHGLHLVNFWGEIHAVQAGLRPAALLEVPRELLSIHLGYLRANNILHKELTQEELGRKRNIRNMRTSADRKSNAIMVYIARTESILRELMELDALDKSEEMGRLLGYPPCCIEYYQKAKKDSSLKNNAKSAFKYISHQPCAITCAESIQMEQKLEKEIRKYCPASRTRGKELTEIQK